MEGWYKLHRKLLDSQLWLCEPFTRGQAWVDLIGLANHTYGYFYVRGIKVEVQRGQVAWGEPKLALRWKWSRTKLRKFVKDLEKEQQIIQQKTNVIQVLTIVNYEEYQEKEQQTIQQKDSKRTTERQQKDTYKNNKEEERIKKNEEEIIILPYDSDEFKKWWEIWKDYKKKEHRFNYKSSISEQSALSELNNLAGGREIEAIDIIKYTISNAWKGFVKRKIENNGTNGYNRKQSGGVTDAYREKLARDLQTAINQNTSG